MKISMKTNTTTRTTVATRKKRQTTERITK